MSYAYAILNTDKDVFLSTTDGKQVFPSEKEAEETLIDENPDSVYNNLENAKHLQSVKVTGVNRELYK